MTGQEPPQVDHRDQDHSNDRWANLRAATQSQNLANRPGAKDRTLPKGVYLDKGRIRAAICKDRKIRKLGVFKTVEDARAAYLAAARETYGEFHYPGTPSIFD
jgi:hypothetical protein